MTPEELDSLRTAVFRNTSADPKWLGHWIERFVHSEDISRNDLAAQLGIGVEALVLLCLCRTPRLDHFQEDLRVVCERIGANEEVVARILRQERTLSTWRQAKSGSTAGWLLAASDRDEDGTQSSFIEEMPDDEDQTR